MLLIHSITSYYLLLLHYLLLSTTTALYLFYRSQTTFLKNYNPGQSIWNKLEKFNKTEQDKRKFDIYFLLVFYCHCQSLYLSTQIWDFSSISEFTRVLNLWTSLKMFGNLWGNSYTKFVILDLKFRLFFLANRTSTDIVEF